MKTKLSELHLKKISNFKGCQGPLLLIIMDGVGLGAADAGNAFYQAKTPNLDALMKEPLYTKLRAHGTAVGMPSDSDMGNSEVGHNALGAGRVFEQGAKRVKEAIETRAMFQGRVWNELITNVKTHKSTLHFIGLLSDGNVHSHIDHLIAMLYDAVAVGVKSAAVHALLDGRDVGEKTALIYIARLEHVLQEINTKNGSNFRIASGGGRMVTTMDRYGADWSIVKRGWDAHVLGQARAFDSATQAVENMYQEDAAITDQYLPAFVIKKSGQPVGTIKDNDSVIFFNFRGDRAIEITQAFEQSGFNKFDRVRHPKVVYAGMMQYDGDLQLPKRYLVEPPQIDRTISHYLCAEHIKMFAISETQKFGHVTYFWNGNNSGYIDPEYETYIEIPSDKIAFDKKPDMKAVEIADKTCELLRSGEYRFGRVNFANGDMVGHTGVLAAAIRACETVDACVGRLVACNRELQGMTIVTADHGNCEVMFEKNDPKKVVTSHTLNPVPFIIIPPNNAAPIKMATIQNPGLANIAATLLNFLGFEPPSDYEPSLIQ